jgi:POT family proton-dependent oligopeptide transporter
LIQFWLSQDIFGNIGLKPVKKDVEALQKLDTDKRVPFTSWQLGVIFASATLGLLWIINAPATKITKGEFNIFGFLGENGNHYAIITALILFIVLLVYRLMQYSTITRQKLIAVTFFAFITIFFWAIFEQSPNSLTVFAEKYTNRVLTGDSSVIFLVLNSLMTLLPLLIINWVMYQLFRKTFAKYSIANITLCISFVIIWIIALWMLTKDFYEAGYLALSDSTLSALKLDSLFIITLAPLFSKIWESKYNPSANFKYGIGMFLLGLGMVAVAFGASGIAPGAEMAKVSMIWLILVFLFHTMGELCVSPVGLSYVSKLVPARMIAFMFGVWYLAVAIGMKGAGMFGEEVEAIANDKGISYFFWMLAIVSFVLGAFSIVSEPVIKKLMHGIK